MKKTLIIITALLLIVGCSKPINESTLLKRGELMYEANATKPFSGKVFELYDNGLKAFEGTYKDGFRHGDWTYNTEVGNSKYNVTYTVGNYNLVVFTDSLGTNYTGSPVIDEPEQDGTYLGQGRKGEYDFSIYPIVHVTFKDGKPDGLTTHWYKNGQKKIEETYNDGKNEGKYTSWYENGQKKKEETYKDGQRDGAWTQWYANGQKEKEETYKDGQKDGAWTQWHANGQKEKEETYKDGQRDGAWTQWRANGQKSWEETYRDGKKSIKSADEYFSASEIERIAKNIKVSLDNLYNLTKHYPEHALVPQAQYLIGDIYMNDLIDFENAIVSFNKVVNNFPGSSQEPLAQFMVGYIYANFVGDTEQAISTYQTFIEKYPGHELTPSVKFELENLGKSIDEIPALKHIIE
jgi:antitoxin component YwqK of YwqJK toxin-antitoxin module|tara:strand:- start:46 stop:1266 length:1221 start_codon:yes stop_codon:yes gene_type:complete